MEVKEGEIASKDLALKLLEKYSAIEIATAYVELCTFPPIQVEMKQLPTIEPVKITKEEFNNHFKIVDEQGEPIKRGRKSKKEKKEE